MSKTRLHLSQEALAGEAGSDKISSPLWVGPQRKAGPAFQNFLQVFSNGFLGRFLFFPLFSSRICAQRSPATSVVGVDCCGSSVQQGAIYSNDVNFHPTVPRSTELWGASFAVKGLSVVSRMI